MPMASKENSDKILQVKKTGIKHFIAGYFKNFKI